MITSTSTWQSNAQDKARLGEVGGNLTSGSRTERFDPAFFMDGLIQVLPKVITPMSAHEPATLVMIDSPCLLLKAWKKGFMATFTQEQNEALIHLIIAARHADGNLSLSEADAATLSIGSLDWQSGTALDLYLQQATATVRTAFSSAERREELLHSSCARFPDIGDQEDALHAIQEVLLADGLDPKESAFLDQVRTCFGR